MSQPPLDSGGFLPSPTLTTPASPSPSISSTTSSLPHPRSRALKPGSAKEDAVRRYVEGRLLHISRRYAKKYQPPEGMEGEVVGYVRMGDVCKDLGDVVDVLWISGTPSLQIPYLLNIALALTTYMTAFPPAPIAMFALLRKLDRVFTSLLKGEDSETGEFLPGFEGGRSRGMSRTDMVRVKSLVESTRVLVVEVMSKEPEDEGEDESEPDGEGGESNGWMGDDEEMEMDVARVYEGTIVMLNEFGFGFVAGEGPSS
ncbi:hypothetical protein BJ875DRAFT_433367 [Amylocarpus encephaloides]|uniref:Meiotic recombination protein DMC1 n=1 Tax=Amylocarpus encephaloides TaxID=45428 RepID=A0A9P7YAP8_9HELO|nr:hypothetical protein BJ875DRAFT_433367 [Amylocarpus encephaloides]